MKDIQPIEIWVNGQNKQAVFLDAMIINDDLESSCTFFYKLLGTELSQVLATGNIIMAGQDYQDWDNSNDQAYSYIASKINATIL